MIWRIFKYIQHLFYRKHRKGHGIHSPYLFDFIHQVLFNASLTLVPKEIIKNHRELSNALSEPHSVRSFVRSSSINEKNGALLFRISNWLKPAMVLELGTGLGISGMYLASGSVQSRVHTIEGNSQRAVFSDMLFKRIGLAGVKVHYGDVDEELERLTRDMPANSMAFVDANHHYEPTIRYLRLLVQSMEDEAVIVMDDIYWSKGMNLAWKEVISWSRVRVSIDLFHMGILLLRKDLNKTHLKIKF